MKIRLRPFALLSISLVTAFLLSVSPNKPTQAIELHPFEPLAPDGPCADPNEPNDDYTSATSIAYGASLTGLDICDPDFEPPLGEDIDYYQFSGSAGDLVSISVIGSLHLDAELTLYNTDGTSVLAYNDDKSFWDVDPYIAYILPVNGTYFFSVREIDGYQGSLFTYELSLTLAGSGVVGPVVYDDWFHVMFDTDGDGIIECGEAVQIQLDMRNQGTDPVTAGDMTASFSDPFITWTGGTTSTMPAIPPGGFVTSQDTYDFSVDPSTLHGHIFEINLQVTADNGGPWNETVELEISCDTTRWVYLPVVLNALP